MRVRLAKIGKNHSSILITMENVTFMTHRLTHIQRERDVICDDLQQISKLFGTFLCTGRTHG